MSLTTNALVSVAEFLTFMGWAPESHAEDVPLIEMVIESVSVAISGNVDVTLKSATFTAQKIDGSGKSYLLMPNYPITTLTSVVEDGTTLTSGTDFYADLDDGVLWKEKSNWPVYDVQARWTSNPEGVVATYVAGYVTLPADIKLGCLVEAARALNMVKNQMFGETSRSVENVSVTVSSDELLPSTLATLSRYLRPRI